jgi:hypothetical protein
MSVMERYRNVKKLFILWSTQIVPSILSYVIKSKNFLSSKDSKEEYSEEL